MTEMVHPPPTPECTETQTAKEEGSEWIDPADPIAKSIIPGLPVNKDVGPVVGQDYIAAKTVQFTVTKVPHSWAGEDWTITDNNGEVVFNVVRGKFDIFKARRHLTDPDGNPILRMQKKPWTFKSTWNVFSAEGEEQIWTMNKSGFFKLFKPSMNVYLPSNANLKVPDYHVRGNLFARRGSIIHGKDTVAEIDRIMTEDNVLLEEDMFTVTVFQGVDYAFIISLIIIADMIYLHNNTKHRRYTGAV